MASFRSVRLVVALIGAVAAVVGSGCSPTGKPVTCPTGQSSCGGICFDLQADPLTCGTCHHRCPAGATCLAGVCACPAGESVCGSAPGACVDLASDPLHCGGCDLACGLGTCGGSACTCYDAASPCIGPGAQCVAPLTDPANCGTCRHACPTRATCETGSCQCPASAPDVCGDACVDRQTDERNCGACGTSCPTGATCTAGACLCPSGAPATCGNACVNLQTDEANCGGCGVRCATDATCEGGSCQCPASAPDVCGNACVDTQTDERNCGTCTTACTAAQACSLGTCCPSSQFACNSTGGTACCAGTGCCAGGCQTAHSNGLGQTSFDCVPLATTGNFTLAGAQQAARAWAAAGNPGTTATTPSCTSCYGWQAAGACAVWCYTGSVAEGQVALNVISNVCLCPPQGQPKSWN